MPLDLWIMQVALMEDMTSL